MTYNPSLTEIPRDQVAAVIPGNSEPILDWLERSGRLTDGPAIEVALEDDEDVVLDQLITDYTIEGYDDDATLHDDD